MERVEKVYKVLFPDESLMFNAIADEVLDDYDSFELPIFKQELYSITEEILNDKYLWQDYDEFINDLNNLTINKE